MKSRKTISRAEVEALRARLEEAEQTLEAIRTGKVDALVVSGAAGERVFTLQGADHRYRRIVEGMTEGAIIASPTGLILYANTAFAELVATPLERVLGSRLRQYVPASATAKLDRLLREARAGTVTTESVLLANGAPAIPVHISAATDGEIAQGGVCLIVTNLTDAMEAAERRFQFVADMLPQIIWSARPDGTTDYFNRRWYEYTGMTPARSMGRGWQEVVHPDDLQACADAWTRSVSTGEGYEVSYRFKRASDGAYRWHLGRALAQRDASGTILCWYGTCTDIEDERALSAEAQRARDRALETTRLKDEFVATVSHELRTPLNAILGWGRMLQSGATPPDKRAHAIDTIVRNAISQGQLIDDLLDVSRIVSGNLRLNVDIVDAAHIVAAAVDVVQPAADAKGLHLRCVIDSDAAMVSGDAGRLQQVVWNLLSNAVKFTPREGTIDVRLRRVDSVIELSVTDSGAGIAARFLPFAFDRFRQQDGAVTRRAGGLGLGLAIVKSLVELHGGTVDAHSEGEGLGSTFTVRIPIAAVRPSSVVPARGRVSTASPPEGIPVVSRPAEVAGLKVLVVDDEPDARDLLRAVLEYCEAKVTTASSAAEALGVVEMLKPDVIVSDIGMPVDDGYTFIRRLREKPRESGGRTPAVALTAYARPEDRRRALLAGFQSHAAKPIDPQELVVVVASLAGRYS
jgi:PAS domain S-box-containing protein